MATDKTHKLDEIHPDRPLGPAPGDGAPPRRRRRAEQSVDTFAIAEPPTAPADDPLLGDEPAVFGGRTPEPAADTVAASTAPIADEAMNMPANSLLYEPLPGEALLAEAPRINIKKVARSTPFLITLLIVLLVGATVFIRKSVPTETYVQTQVSFVNYDQLDEAGQNEVQLEIAKLLRTYPLRAQAWSILQEKHPGLPPGFLNSGLTFHRFDAIQWEPSGILHVRVDTSDPSRDVVRLDAVMEAFYVQAQERNAKRDQSQEQLSAAQDQQFELLQLDTQLKQRIEQLLPGAQRYMDLKAALQATERYLDLADDSNPLRLVARQNLRRLTVQVADARRIAVERDEMLAQRIDTQKRIEALTTEIARLRRYIDTFSYPLPHDPKHLAVHDTRPYQQKVLRYTWLLLIATFAGIIGTLHYLDHRITATEREVRRQRRRQVVAHE